MSITTDDLIRDGYQTWDGVDAFEDWVGPFYFKQQEDGSYRSAFISEDRHKNGGGMLHGGLLMTFADFALFTIAKDHLDGMFVTLGFNAEFVSAGPAGALIEAKGEVTRATRSVIFVRGEIFCADRTIMTFSGIIKKIKQS
jgi:uncharacterized protein (TIGR00369 family)